MNKLIITLPIIALVLAGAATWLMLRHPLRVFAWFTRRALKSAGLKQVMVPSPRGPQSVFVGGSGPLLVLLHGAGDHAGTWARVAPALSKRYTLVVPDLAGHGDSAPGAGPIETAAIFEGLEAVLASQAGTGPLILVGNSLGAWMAMVLAHRHPERVARVVAVNGGPLPGSGTVNLLPATREEARATMALLRDPGNPAVPDHVLDDLVRQRAHSPLARFAGTWATMGPWLMDEAQLRTLAMPVRLVWGVADQLMPLDYARRMQAALPDAALFPVPRSGHVPHQEAPKRFLEALDQALA